MSRRKKGIEHIKAKEGYKKCTICGTYIQAENAVYHCKVCDNRLKNAIRNKRPEVKIYY